MRNKSSDSKLVQVNGRGHVLQRRRRVIFPECYKDPQNTKEKDVVRRTLSPNRTANLSPLGRKELDKLFPASPCVSKAAPNATQTRNNTLPSFPHLTEQEDSKEEEDPLLAMLPRGVRQTSGADDSRKLKHVSSYDTWLFGPRVQGTRRKFLEISPYKSTTVAQAPSTQTRSESILRPSSYVKKRLEDSSNTSSSTEESTESIPSLASTECSDDEHAPIAADACCIRTPTSSAKPAIAIQTNKAVFFDPRIWVCEFQRSREEFGRTWYTPMDLDKFKRVALQRVMEMQNANAELIPTGTGRLVRCTRGQTGTQMTRALFTNPALSCLDDEDDAEHHELCLQRLGKQEIRHVLVVDPHDICLKLFSKSIKSMLPHVSIVTARSSEEAMRRLGENKLGFDMVIVEERLRLLFQGGPQQAVPNSDDAGSPCGQPATSGSQHMVSGAALFRVLKECTGSKNLFVGVTSQPDKYGEKLRNGGADVVWSKPPPAMDKTMRDSLLKMILNKRGKENHVAKHFV